MVELIGADTVGIDVYAVRYGAAYFQVSLKLSRAYGVATVLVCHRPSDLTAQLDDGTASAKIAAGLLSEIQTRVLLRQPLGRMGGAGVPPERQPEHREPRADGLER